MKSTTRAQYRYDANGKPCGIEIVADCSGNTAAATLHVDSEAFRRAIELAEIRAEGKALGIPVPEYGP